METWFTNGPNETHTVETNIKITVLMYWQSCQYDDNHLKMQVEANPAALCVSKYINNARNCFPSISMCILNTNFNGVKPIERVVKWSEM